MGNFFKLLFIFLLIFSCGCKEEEAFEQVYVNNDPSAPSTPSPPEPEPSPIEEYISNMFEDPQSPETFVNSIPGYFNFCGIIASAGNIELQGYTKVIGGLYSLKNIIVGSGVVIVEDIDCINKTRESLHSPRGSLPGSPVPAGPAADTNEVLNVFHGLRYPLDMRSIPSRVIIMKYTEIPANEKSLEESSFDSHF